MSATAGSIGVGPLIFVDGEPIRVPWAELPMSARAFRALKDAVRVQRGDLPHHEDEEPVDHSWHDLGEAGA